MISPQWYQPDQRENTEPDLETMRHRGLMVTLNRELTWSLGRFPREGRRKSWVSMKNMYISDK